jgi:hypothetical protein
MLLGLIITGEERLLRLGKRPSADEPAARGAPKGAG